MSSDYFLGEEHPLERNINNFLPVISDLAQRRRGRDARTLTREGTEPKDKETERETAQEKGDEVRPPVKSLSLFLPEGLFEGSVLRQRKWEKREEDGPLVGRERARVAPRAKNKSYAQLIHSLRVGSTEETVVRVSGRVWHQRKKTRKRKRMRKMRLKVKAGRNQ